MPKSDAFELVPRSSFVEKSNYDTANPCKAPENFPKEAQVDPNTIEFESPSPLK